MATRVQSVIASSDARKELPALVQRFRNEGVFAEPLIFGAHRKPEAAVIPFELYAELLPAIEELEIAALVRERAGAGPAVPLADIAAEFGFDPSDYR